MVTEINCILKDVKLYKELRGILVSELKLETNYVDRDADEVCTSISVTDNRLLSSEPYARIEERREFKIGNKTYIILLYFSLAAIVGHKLKDFISASDLIEASIKNHYTKKEDNDE